MKSLYIDRSMCMKKDTIVKSLYSDCSIYGSANIKKVEYKGFERSEGAYRKTEGLKFKKFKGLKFKKFKGLKFKTV